MELIFLGTSSGVPTKTRNVSAIALVDGSSKSWHLIDCGEGTQHQLLHSHLTLNSLSTIFLTHLHGDHCYGLPGLLASAGLSGRKKPLRIVCPEGTKQWIEATVKMSELYLPYDLEFIDSENARGCEFNRFSVETVELSHRINSYAYVFTETNIRPSLCTDKVISAGIPQGPLWGEIKAGKDIEYDNKQYAAAEFLNEPRAPQKIIICGDNDQPELLKGACDNCDVLVHESTFAEHLSEQAKNVGHSYARQIASFVEQAGVPNVVLTHISARYTTQMAMLEDEAMSAYSGNLFIANDFDHFVLNDTGTLELK